MSTWFTDRKFKFRGPEKPKNKIVVIEKGQVVEQGKHEELLARRGVYYRLYMHTFQRQAERV